MYSDQEKKEIAQRYRILLRYWKNRKDEGDARMVRQAFDLAVEAHADMRRRSKEPYVFHPLEVATICAKDMRLDATSIVCALLHDVVEDTDITLEEIEQRFNPRIAMIIGGLTKMHDVLDDGQRSIQAEYFKRMILALAEDMRVILIKLADRLHNMRTLDHMPRDKQLKIASETLVLYAPLAYRIGLYNIKTELEDLSLKYTEPEVYDFIKSRVAETQMDRDRFINRFIYPIKNTLNQHNIPHMIHVRLKSVYSIWQKMQRQNINFEDVYDVFAIRVVVDSPRSAERIDCWSAYSLITEIYKPKHDRIRDWISIPKANGYEALHTTVMSHLGKWVEIQIRSRRMHEVAESGYASHHYYKNMSDESSAIDNWLIKIKEQFQNPENDALDFLDDFKLDLYSEEIYTFTPKGDMIKLPVGATALDFAYTIHTEIGRHSLGAKVNLALVPLKYVLKSGDQVEIITSKKQVIQEEWLNFVITSRAKNYIKEGIKEEKKNYYNKGKERLKELFEESGVELSKQILKKFQENLRYTSRIDLYFDVATGKVGHEDIKACCPKTGKTQSLLNSINPFTKSKPEAKSLSENISEKIRNKPEEVLLGENTQIKYDRASCCNPIPGDDIIGLITPNKPIMIHRVNCKNAQKLMSSFGKRIVKAKWYEKKEILFLAGIEFRSIDKIGFIHHISDIISNKHQLKIRSFNLNSSNDVTDGRIMLYVHDTQKLNDLIHDLKKIKEIKKISRLNPA